MLEQVFLQLLNMSFTGGIVILAVLLLRLLLKKAPRRFSYLLWAVVLLRLVCPFTLESAVSLIRVNPTPLSTDIFTTDTPRVETGLPVVDEAVNGALSERYPATETITPTPAPEDNVTDTPAPDATPSVPDTPVSPLATPMQIASVVWLCGIGVMAVYSVVSLWRLRRRLVGAMRLKDNVWLADHINTPFVLGLFRPKIYLPSTVRKEEREYILLHEQTHIRHGDHIVRLIAFIVLAVYWFHPLVWVAFLLSTRDMEMACDESVLKTLGPDIRAAYSQSLLSFTTGRRRIAATPLAFGEGDTKSRIRNVLHYKKPALWAIIAGVTACCVAAVCLLTTAAPAKEPEESGESSENAESSESTAESEEEIVYTGDETGVWHRITYTAENGKDTLTEWEFTLEKEGETLWYTLKKWDYVPRSKEVVELLDREALAYGGKTYVATRTSDTGRKQGEKDQYGEYALDEGWISGRLLYFPVGDYLRFDSAEGAMEFSRKRELPVELSKLQGEWYELQVYEANGYVWDRVLTIDTATMQLKTKERLLQKGAGTELTYNNISYGETGTPYGEETVYSFTISGNKLKTAGEFYREYGYDVTRSVVYGQDYETVYTRDKALPEPDPILQGEWNYICYYADTNSFYGRRLGFYMTNAGLMADAGETQYSVTSLYEDEVRFVYQGQKFSAVGGGGGIARFYKTDENTYASYMPGMKATYTYDPQTGKFIESIPEFNTDGSTAVYTYLKGAYRLDDLDAYQPGTTAPTTSTTTTTKATTVATVATEKLKLKAEGILWFTPSGSGKDAELLMAEEQAAELAELLNRQAVEKKAYKGTGDYTFTLGGQHFSVDAGEGWLNLLDEKGASVMKSVKLSAADTKTLNALLADASELKFDDGNVPVPRYLVNIEGGQDNVVLFSTQKGETIKLPEGYTFKEMWDTDIVEVFTGNDNTSLWNLQTNTLFDYKADAKAAMKKAGLCDNGETIEVYWTLYGSDYCPVLRRLKDDTTESYAYNFRTGTLCKMPYHMASDYDTPSFINNTHALGIVATSKENSLYLMDMRSASAKPILVCKYEKITSSSREQEYYVHTFSVQGDMVGYHRVISRNLSGGIKQTRDAYFYDTKTGKTVTIPGTIRSGLLMDDNAVVIHTEEEGYRLFDVKTGVDLTEKYFNQIPLHERAFHFEAFDGTLVITDYFTNQNINFKLCEWEGEMVSHWEGHFIYVYPPSSGTMYIVNLATSELTTVKLPDSFVKKEGEFMSEGNVHYQFNKRYHTIPLPEDTYVSMHVLRVSRDE